jgi:uncharacterized protein YjiS (DUF1127 family)
MAKTIQFEGSTGRTSLPLPASPQQPGLGASLLAGPARLVHAVFKEWRYRKAVNELHQLDDRMLRDIGVARSEIPTLARGGRDIF